MLNVLDTNNLGPNITSFDHLIKSSAQDTGTRPNIKYSSSRLQDIRKKLEHIGVQMRRRNNNIKVYLLRLIGITLRIYKLRLLWITAPKMASIYFQNNISDTFCCYHLSLNQVIHKVICKLLSSLIHIYLQNKYDLVLIIIL